MPPKDERLNELEADVDDLFANVQKQNAALKKSQQTSTSENSSKPTRQNFKEVLAGYMTPEQQVARKEELSVGAVGSGTGGLVNARLFKQTRVVPNTKAQNSLEQPSLSFTANDQPIDLVSALKKAVMDSMNPESPQEIKDALNSGLSNHYKSQGFDYDASKTFGAEKDRKQIEKYQEKVAGWRYGASEAKFGLVKKFCEWRVEVNTQKLNTQIEKFAQAVGPSVEGDINGQKAKIRQEELKQQSAELYKQRAAAVAAREAAQENSKVASNSWSISSLFGKTKVSPHNHPTPPPAQVGSSSKASSKSGWGHGN